MENYSIYPRQFRNIKQNYDKDMCFIIMPFNKKKNTVYETIKKAIAECHLNYDRSDELKKSAPFISKIISSISKAYYLIVDISDLNANVLYELGIAHTLRDADRVLILKDSKTICPSDLKHINYFEYAVDDTETLFKHVKNFLEANHYIKDLKDLLIISNILDSAKEADEIVQILNEQFSTHCISLIYILNNAVEELDMREVSEILIGLYDILCQSIIENKLLIADNLSKLLCFIIKKLSQDFNLSSFTRYVFSDLNVFEDAPEWRKIKTDIAISLLKFDYPNKDLFSWIKIFLYNSSPAAVDIERYKLHVAIINTSTEQVKAFLVNILLEEENVTLIEHSLNMCRAKSINDAVDCALRILAQNDNPFIFRSAIDYIVDVGTTKQQSEMFRIINERNDIVEQNQFINVHIERAKKKNVS